MTQLPNLHTLPLVRGLARAMASTVSALPLAIAIAAFLATLALSESAFAAHKHGHKSNAAAAAAASKEKAVDLIRAQIAAAQQVLITAESAAGASQAQLDEVRKRMIATRKAMSEAVDEEREARQHLQELEAKVLEAQPSDSKFGRAEARLAAARGVVAEFRTRYDDDCEGLNSDAEYRAAMDAVSIADRDYDHIREAVLAKNQDWQKASQELRELLAGHREEQKAGSGSPGMLSAGPSLHNAQEIAATARQVIAAGEMRLRQMGEKVSS